MTKTFAGALLITLVAVPLAAQQNGISSRVTAQMGGRFADAGCQLKEGHFLVSSGKTKLSSAMSASDPVIAGRLIKEGSEVVQDAIATKGQDKNPGAWYWLARLSLQQGDLIRADSAFKRAEAMAPQCKADIQKYREKAWSALVVGAQKMMEDKQTDSALILYGAANQISTTAPHAFHGIGSIYYDLGQADSAIKYFSLAGATEPTDPNHLKLRNQDLFSAGALLVNEKRPQQALPLLQRYHKLVPEDPQGLKALAQAYRGSGMADSAQVLERQMVAAAGTGEAGGGEVSEGDLFDIAVKQFNDKNYTEAAATFGRIIAINPWNRDAVFNQANAYLALKDGPNLVRAADQLILIEPLSEMAYSLRVQGYRLVGNKDELLKVIFAQEALLINVEVENLKVSGDGATLVAKATGRDARDEANKAISPKPQLIVVEFLGTGGGLVASQEVQLGALKKDEAQPISATAKGSGIRGWRYKVK